MRAHAAAVSRRAANKAKIVKRLPAGNMQGASGGYRMLGSTTSPSEDVSASIFDPIFQCGSQSLLQMVDGELAFSAGLEAMSPATMQEWATNSGRGIKRQSEAVPMFTPGASEFMGGGSASPSKRAARLSPSEDVSDHLLRLIDSHYLTTLFAETVGPERLGYYLFSNGRGPGRCNDGAQRYHVRWELREVNGWNNSVWVQQLRRRALPMACLAKFTRFNTVASGRV
jgi:hypothetical protein